VDLAGDGAAEGIDDGGRSRGGREDGVGLGAGAELSAPGLRKNGIRSSKLASAVGDTVGRGGVVFLAAIRCAAGGGSSAVAVCSASSSYARPASCVVLTRLLTKARERSSSFTNLIPMPGARPAEAWVTSRVQTTRPIPATICCPLASERVERGRVGRLEVDAARADVERIALDELVDGHGPEAHAQAHDCHRSRLHAC
jgi:hypothetical protein